MNLPGPLVLIAAVSSHERRAVESLLERTGLATRGVDDAVSALVEIAGNDRTVLVIDAGLLEAAHDGQWRALRARHPALAAVVRALVPRGGGLHHDGRTRVIHPDDEDGIRRAVCDLSARSTATPSGTRCPRRAAPTSPGSREAGG